MFTPLAYPSAVPSMPGPQSYAAAHLPPHLNVFGCSGNPVVPGGPVYGEGIEQMRCQQEKGNSLTAPSFEQFMPHVSNTSSFTYYSTPSTPATLVHLLHPMCESPLPLAPDELFRQTIPPAEPKSGEIMANNAKGATYDLVDSSSLKQWDKKHGGGPPSPIRYKINTTNGSRKDESANAQQKHVKARREEEADQAKAAQATGKEQGTQAIQAHLKKLNKQKAPKKLAKMQKKAKKDAEDIDKLDESGEEDGDTADKKAIMFSQVPPSGFNS
jgi:hypothetical protein